MRATLTALTPPVAAADEARVRADDLVLVQGARDTRATLTRWNLDAGPVLLPWIRLAAGVAVALLCATWLVASLSTPDATRLDMPGVLRPATLADAGPILVRNGLVLALHAFACLAGFIAGSSLPREAERYSGFTRAIHDRAGAVAMAFVACATVFSLCTQAYILGGQASTLAAQVGLSPGLYLFCLLPHALPELTALFLPLAAWLIAARRGQSDDLLAATLVTVALAIPTLVLCAIVELEVSPRIVVAIAG
jgi:hypothetical protein